MKIYTLAPRRTADPVLHCSTIADSGDITATCSRGFFRRTLIAILAGMVSLTLLSGKTAAQTTATASSVKEGIIKLADSDIEYFSRGEGETIVLLPGGTLTVDYLDGLAEALAKGGYRVVGINFRGSGKSTGPSTGVTLQTMAKRCSRSDPGPEIGVRSRGRKRLWQPRGPRIGVISS
jgi:hypothetical protein